jgi:hypothetical protein
VAPQAQVDLVDTPQAAVVVQALVQAVLVEIQIILRVEQEELSVAVVVLDY